MSRYVAIHGPLPDRFIVRLAPGVGNPRGVSALSAQRLAAQGSIEDFDRMQRPQSAVLLLQEPQDVQGASRVRAHAQARSGANDVLDFSFANLVCARRFDQIVNARAPAALISVGDLADRQAWNAREERSGLARNALRVPEVTGVVIGDLRVDRVANGAS